ncbi:hypothetical protein [Alkalibacterium kapii]|uniref:Uncharacterized protein n=1 Tax=Alkalibacterium kapii TaxID=426704 RepID=A0A511ASL4_9LACT|nr:hypothetical protein [Alkalibacterium kapii]GEK90732.1 hypothetical protein AKA01nite_03540 [Alkalibacterium kapii]
MVEDSMSLYFLFNMLHSIISVFFKETILVAAFFFLLNKTFENELLKKVSAWMIGIITLIILIFAVMISY